MCGRDAVQTVDWRFLCGRVIVRREMDVRVARRGGRAWVYSAGETGSRGWTGLSEEDVNRPESNHEN